MTDNTVSMDTYEIEEYLLEEAREKNRKNKKKYIYIPDKIEIFSVNDMW